MNQHVSAPKSPLSALLPTHDHNATTRQWFAAAIAPGQEERAELHLRRQGFEPFTPRLKRTVRHARRLTIKNTPFFPGYLFIPLDLGRDRWRSVNGTTGVRYLVMQGERPAACPHGFVERLIAMTDAGGALDLASSLSPGAAVRVISGPFTDLVGVLEKLDSAGRARVLVQILNGQTAVTMDVRALIEDGSVL